MSTIRPKNIYSDGHRFALSECQIYQPLEVRNLAKLGMGQQKGLFAKAPIAKGSVIAVAGGIVLTSIADLPQSIGYAEQLSKDLMLAPKNYDDMEPLWFMNHDCDPNVGRIGGLVNVAARSIEADEEHKPQGLAKGRAIYHALV